MGTRSLSDIFNITSKDKGVPPCIGTYVAGTTQCLLCEWKKECIEYDEPFSDEKGSRKNGKEWKK